LETDGVMIILIQICKQLSFIITEYPITSLQYVST